MGKSHLGRARRKWEGNITIDLKEIGVNLRNWVDSARDRVYWSTLVNLFFCKLAPHFLLLCRVLGSRTVF